MFLNSKNSIIGIIIINVLLFVGCQYRTSSPDNPPEPAKVIVPDSPPLSGGEYTKQKEEQLNRELAERRRLEEQAARISRPAPIREPIGGGAAASARPAPPVIVNNTPRAPVATVPSIPRLELPKEVNIVNKQILTDRILDQMTEQGQSLIFDVPKIVKIDQVFQASMKIDPTKTEQELIKEARYENPTVKSVKVSSIVRAEIKVDEENFKVKNLTSSEQGLVAKEATVWAWELTALKPGQHSINLVVTGVVELDGKRIERNIKYETTEITTNITVLEKMQKWFENLDFKWLIGLILGGIFIPLILSYLKKKYDLGK